MNKTAIKTLYSEIIEKERAINPHWTNIALPGADEMYNIASRFYFVVGQAFVPRSGFRYLMAKDARRASQMFESVSAHTNLVTNMVHHALNYYYGANFSITKDGYSLSEALEVVARHDLPEVIFGDTPDDKTRDEKKKNYEEALFQQDYAAMGPARDRRWEHNVGVLLREFVYLNSPTARLIYSGDKVSAILLALCADDKKLDLCLRKREHCKIAPNDELATKIIDGGVSKSYRISEIWSVSHFKTREFVKFDETGYMTCLLIMYTLRVHGKWYAWREADYVS